MGSVLNTFIPILAGVSDPIIINNVVLKPNEILGLTSGAAGLTMTLSVLPSGILTDLAKRDTMMKVASVLGFIAIVCVHVCHFLRLGRISIRKIGSKDRFSNERSS